MKTYIFTFHGRHHVGACGVITTDGDKKKARRRIKEVLEQDGFDTSDVTIEEYNPDEEGVKVILDGDY
jgi:predicted rRNA methylase YqxC with S4 and FtsJ domains